MHHLFEKTCVRKKITAAVQILDDGYVIVVTGGDKSHIGAISSIDEKGQKTNTVFPGHKELVISEKWADEIYQRMHTPVTVIAGIHYDGIARVGIEEVMNCTDQLINEIQVFLYRAIEL